MDGSHIGELKKELIKHWKLNTGKYAANTTKNLRGNGTGSRQGQRNLLGSGTEWPDLNGNRSKGNIRKLNVFLNFLICSLFQRHCPYRTTKIQRT